MELAGRRALEILCLLDLVAAAALLVARAFNGVEMNSPANALEVYPRLQGGSRIGLELERGRGSIRKSYSIR